jgi:hypothetical protein
VSATKRGGLLVLAALMGGGATLFWPLLLAFFDSLHQRAFPQQIDWDSKIAWAKCDGALVGKIPWPRETTSACEAMAVCANEAQLNADQRQKLAALAAAMPGCAPP